MARYIDADALIEVLQRWRYASSLNDGAGNPADSILYDVIRHIEDAPTADVAPRAEVAKEIFAEIKENGSFSDPCVLHIVLSFEELAEIEKKYMEADHDTA